MTPIPSRKALLDAVAQASLSGYLGLFVGTGFSISCTNGAAPTFERLLREVVDRLALPIDIGTAPTCKLKSLPQIASVVLADLTARSTPPERAGERLREAIAHVCNISPQPPISSQLTDALSRLRPNWIITTNYDLVLETLLDRSVSVLPDQPLVPHSERVPIYHLHGHRLAPNSIKITEEDYVGLLGPIDYQRLKLPLILVESTTVMLGYALGDINVRAALEWSRSFRGAGGVRLASGQGSVIQALYKPGAPRPDPYVGPNGEFVIEIADIPSFLAELAENREKREQELKGVQEAIELFISDPVSAPAVAAHDSDARQAFLKIVEEALPYAQATRIIEFLNKVLDPIWELARMDSGFAYYDTYLVLLLDVLAKINVRQCYPGLLTYLAEALDRVGWYIDPGKHYGTAWEATDTWIARHREIGTHMLGEIHSYAEINFKTGLFRLFNALPGPPAPPA